MDETFIDSAFNKHYIKNQVGETDVCMLGQRWLHSLGVTKSTGDRNLYTLLPLWDWLSGLINMIATTVSPSFCNAKTETLGGYVKTFKIPQVTEQGFKSHFMMDGKAWDYQKPGLEKPSSSHCMHQIVFFQYICHFKNIKEPKLTTK